MEKTQFVLPRSPLILFFIALTACPSSEIVTPLLSGDSVEPNNPQFSVQPETVSGWVDGGSSYKIRLRYQNEGSHYECRLTKGPGPGSGAFSACGIDNGTDLEVDVNDLSHSGPDGKYFFEVKAVNHALESAVLTTTTYMHGSLNGLAKCNVGIDPQPYFNEAATYLNMSTPFGSSTSLINPDLQIEFADGTVVNPLSLRRRLVLNSDRTLLMVYRVLESKQNTGSCDQHVGQFQRDCTAFIFNAQGEGLCVINAGGGVVYHDNGYENIFQNVRGKLYGPNQSGIHKGKLFSAKRKDLNDWSSYSWPTYLPD